jgi:hypothetical protein
VFSLVLFFCSEIFVSFPPKENQNKKLAQSLSSTDSKGLLSRCTVKVNCQLTYSLQKWRRCLPICTTIPALLTCHASFTCIKQSQASRYIPMYCTTTGTYKCPVHTMPSVDVNPNLFDFLKDIPITLAFNTILVGTWGYLDRSC